MLKGLFKDRGKNKKHSINAAANDEDGSLMNVAEGDVPLTTHQKLDLKEIAHKARHCTPGTQLWLFHLVNTWFNSFPQEQDRLKRVILFEGFSGFGKSVFMSKLAAICDPKKFVGLNEEGIEAPCYIGAVHFFSKFDLSRANVKTLIRSISDQLRSSVPGFTEALVAQPEVVKDNQIDEFYLRRLTVGALFRTLIGNPAKQVDRKKATLRKFPGKSGGKNPRVVILLDALNDCERQYLEPLLRILGNWNTLTPPWLCLLITVTKKHNAAQAISSLYFVEHVDLSLPAFDEHIAGDVEKHAVVSLSNLGTKLPDMVVQQKAKEILPFTENRMLYIDALAVLLAVEGIDLNELSDVELPQGMNAIYTRVFKGIRGKFPEEYQKILRPLLAARVPLPVLMWRESCTEVSEAKFNELRNVLGSFLFEVEGTARISHRSIYEYLKMHENPEMFLARMQQKRANGVEIFSGHLKADESVEGGMQDSVKRMKEQFQQKSSVPRSVRNVTAYKDMKTHSFRGYVSQIDVRKYVPASAKGPTREEANDILLIDPRLGHKALARSSWRIYTTEPELPPIVKKYVLNEIVFHLVGCQGAIDDEGNETDRDKDAAELLRNFKYNMRRLCGNMEMIVQPGDNLAQNVSAALHDAFNVYLVRHPEDRTVRIIQQVINKGRAALADDPRQFANQVIGRVAEPQEEDDKYLRDFYAAALRYDPKVQWWRPVTPCLDRADVAVLETITEFSPDAVRCVIVSPDGTRIVAASSNGMIKVFETNRGRPLFTLVDLDVEADKRGAVVSLALVQEQDKLLLASGGTDGFYRLWDVETGRKLAVVNISAKGVSALAFWLPAFKVTDPDDDDDDEEEEAESVNSAVETDDGSEGLDDRSVLAVGGLDGKIWFCNYDEKEKPIDLGHPITCIKWSTLLENRSLLAVGLASGSIQLLDYTDLSKLPRILKHTARINDLCFHPTEHWILSCADDHTVTLWDLNEEDDSFAEKRTFKQLCDGTPQVISIAFNTSGTHFAAGTKDGSILLVQTLVVPPEGGEAVAKEAGEEVEGVYLPLTAEFAADPEAEKALLSRQDIPESHSDAKLMLQGHEGRITSVDFFPFSERLVSASKDGYIVFWTYNPRDATEPVEQIIGDRRVPIKNFLHKGDIKVARFSPDNSLLATGGKGKKVIMWDVKTGHSLFEVNLDQAALNLEFEADGSRLKVSTPLRTAIINTKNGSEATASGILAPKDPTALGRELSVNEFITKTPEEHGIAFSMDLPRRGPAIVTNGALAALEEDPSTKEVYAAIPAKDKINIVQLITREDAIDEEIAQASAGSASVV